MLEVQGIGLKNNWSELTNSDSYKIMDILNQCSERFRLFLYYEFQSSIELLKINEGKEYDINIINKISDFHNASEFKDNSGNPSVDREELKSFSVDYKKLLDVFYINKPKYISNILAIELFEVVKPFVISILIGKPLNYEPQGITEFEFEGNEYVLPEVVKFQNEHLLFYKTKAKILEVCDLLSQTQIEDVELALKENEKFPTLENFNLIIAILVNANKNEYDEVRAIEISKTFNNLPMTIVWEVFFCLYSLFEIYQNDLTISLLREEIAKERTIMKEKDGMRHSLNSKKKQATKVRK